MQPTRFALGLIGAALLIGGCRSSTALVDASPIDVSRIDAGPRTFASHADFMTAGYAAAVALADLDDDGRLDLVVADFDTTLVSVLINTTANGAATPSFATKIDFPAGPAPAWVAIVDVDGDARLDIVTANSGADTVSVLLNTTTAAGAPSFAAPVDFTTGAEPAAVATADFNGDGKPDLAVANTTEGRVSVLLNTSSIGAPTFAAHVDVSLGLGATPGSLVAGDVDGDGRADLAIGELDSGAAVILLDATATAATTPTFATKATFRASSRAQSTALADLDGDGSLDLAIVDNDSDSLDVLINATQLGGPAAFGGITPFVTLSMPNAVAVGDLDGDDLADLAIANFGAGTVSVFANTTLTPGLPTFAPRIDYMTGAAPRAVAIADVNGDGMPDLVVGNGQADTVSVLLAQ